MPCHVYVIGRRWSGLTSVSQRARRRQRRAERPRGGTLVAVSWYSTVRASSSRLRINGGLFSFFTIVYDLNASSRYCRRRSLMRCLSMRSADPQMHCGIKLRCRAEPSPTKLTRTSPLALLDLDYGTGYPIRRPNLTSLPKDTQG